MVWCNIGGGMATTGPGDSRRPNMQDYWKQFENGLTKRVRIINGQEVVYIGERLKMIPLADYKTTC
jgi:hypothetical protein